MVPVLDESGLNARLFEHFGRAPYFGQAAAVIHVRNKNGFDIGKVYFAAFLKRVSKEPLVSIKIVCPFSSL